MQRKQIVSKMMAARQDKYLGSYTVLAVAGHISRAYDTLLQAPEEPIEQVV